MNKLWFLLFFLCVTIKAQIIVNGGSVAGATLGTTNAVSSGCTPSYANTGGQGNRTSIITVTEGAGSPVNNSLQHFVDGTYSDGSAFWNNGTALDNSTTWVMFDFLSGHTATITEATYQQSTTTTQGTWQWQGSNDGSNFTNIGSTFTLGGSTSQVINTLSGNTTAYRYYRLMGVSGSTSFTPWIRGMDFKLCYT